MIPINRQGRGCAEALGEIEFRAVVRREQSGNSEGEISVSGFLTYQSTCRYLWEKSNREREILQFKGNYCSWISC